MGDNRFSHSNRNHHQFDAGPNSRVDLFLPSESPRVQEILLHQKLKGEIEKNSASRIRYLDSEIYMKNNAQSPGPGASEVRSTTLNIGGGSASSTLANQLGKTTTMTTTTSAIANHDQSNELKTRAFDHGDKGNSKHHFIVNRNCQVCLIRGVRQNLMNLNKIVQERNEQISKLKAKCLKSHFERQMMD